MKDMRSPLARRALAMLLTTLGCGALLTAPVHGIGVGAPLPLGSTPTAMAFRSARVGYLLAATVGVPGRVTLYRTGDGGLRWRTVQRFHATKASFGLLGGALAMDGSEGEFLAFLGAGACSAGYRLWWTLDGGRRWAAGPTFHGSDGPSAVLFTGPGRGLALNGSCATATAGVWAFAADGAVTPRADLAVPPSAAVAVGPTALSLDAWDGGALEAMAFQPARSGPGGVIVAAVTRDGGASWHPVAFRGRLPVGPVLALGVAAPGHAIAVEGGRGGPVVVATTDGGRRWSRSVLPQGMNAALLSTPTAGAAFLLLRHDFGKAAVLLASADGGRTWHRVALPAGV